MRIAYPFIVVVCLTLAWSAPCARAQDAAPPPTASGQGGVSEIRGKLQQAQAELAALRERIANTQVPVSKELGWKQKQIIGAQDQLNDLQRDLDTRNMRLNNLRNDIKILRDQQSYTSNLIGEYARNLESKLHIAEKNIYTEPIEDAKLAQMNDDLTAAERFGQQLDLMENSIARIEQLNGGARYGGTAVDEHGRVLEGTFAQIGPVVYFGSSDGRVAGLVIERLGSLEPNVVTFGQTGTRGVADRIEGFFLRGADNSSAQDADYGEIVSRVIRTGEGTLPLDTSLGNARKIEETKASLGEHIRKGGVVMVPILGMAALAMLVSLIKWIQLSSVRMPSMRALTPLLAAVARRDVDKAQDHVAELKGPGARMLTTAVQHLHEPRELIEEVMYEDILRTRIRLNKLLPFIAVCASTAPLLGLLGTVTGIINTFKLLTVFGSGDVKMLSSGISEALVTTEFGLIVAIPSLLAYAFLNRKSKSLIDRMEQMAVAVMNQVSKAPEAPGNPAPPVVTSGPAAGDRPADRAEYAENAGTRAPVTEAQGA